MNAKVLVNGQSFDVDVDSKRALTSIPGWAQRQLAMEERGGKLSSLYGESVWAYRCINIRADAIAAIPWRILEGEDELDQDNDLVTLLTEVNPEQNWLDLIRDTEADLNIYGKAYWLKVRNESGTSVPLGLQRLNPSTMKEKADRFGVSHFIQTIDGEDEEFDRDDIVYFRTYDPNNDFGGTSPLDIVRRKIASETEADRYLTDFFKNFAIPPIIFTTKEDVREEELKKAERNWIRTLAGRGNRHKVKFTNKGITPKEIGYSIKDLAMDTVREEIRREICAGFGVPMPMAGASEAANYATMTEQRKYLYTETTIPRAKYIQGVINAELIKEFGDGLHFEFVFDALSVLQPDKQKERESYARLVEAGVLKPEVAAEALGFSPEDAAEPQDILERQINRRTVDQYDGITEKDLMKDDFIKFRRKARRRLKEGSDDAFVNFKSDFIPDHVIDEIQGRLSSAETPDDVNEIFDDYEVI